MQNTLFASQTFNVFWFFDAMMILSYSVLQKKKIFIKLDVKNIVDNVSVKQNAVAKPRNKL